MLLGGFVAETAASGLPEAVDESGRGSGPQSHVDRNLPRRGLRSDPPGLVDEQADALVARPGQPKALGLGADKAIDLGDRHLPWSEALDDVEQALWKPRGDREHPSMLRLDP